MSFIIEAIKHRIELLKLIGIGLCTPFTTSSILILTDRAYLQNHFSLCFFIISFVIMLLGIKCIMRSLDLIDSYLKGKEI